MSRLKSNQPASPVSILQQAFTEPHSVAYRIVHAIVNLFIFVSCVGMALESVDTLNAQYRDTFYAREIVTFVIFSAEYICNIAYARNRLRYIFSFWGLVDLVAIVPSLLMLTVNLQVTQGANVFRLLRVLRVLRVLKLAREAMQQMQAGAAHKRNPLVANLIIYFITLFSALMIFSSLMYQVEGSLYSAAAKAAWEEQYTAENPGQALPENFEPVDPLSGNIVPVDKQFYSSIPTAMWWCIVTLTTTGYGDMYPVTVGGRIIAAFTMLMGLVLFGILMNIVGKTLMVMLFGESLEGHAS